MRSLIVALGMLLMGGAAAQPPAEIRTDNTVPFEVGVTRTFEFEHAVKDVYLATDGVAKVVPLTDHVIAITGVAPGEVLALAYGPDGKLVHSMNIAVAGHLVKIYGYDDTKDYRGYMCSSTGCGRADPDIAPPSSTTVGVTRRLGNGDIVTKTKTYQ